MIANYIFPKNNELKFIKNAQLFGYTKLFCIYEYEKKIKFEDIKNKLSILEKKKEITLIPALLVTSKTISKAQKFTKFLFIDARNESDITIRNLIEKKPPFIIFNLEYQKKDFIHHRNSGLNHITCNLMKKNKVSMGFSFSFILHTNYKDLVFGRMMQNIRFIRKFKFNSCIGSFSSSPDDVRSPNDLKSFFIELGMHPTEAKNSLNS